MNEHEHRSGRRLPKSDMLRHPLVRPLPCADIMALSLWIGVIIPTSTRGICHLLFLGVCWNSCRCQSQICLAMLAVRTQFSYTLFSMNVSQPKEKVKRSALHEVFEIFLLYISYAWQGFKRRHIFPTVVMAFSGFHIWPGLHCCAVWAGSRSLSGDLSPRPTSLIVLYIYRSVYWQKGLADFSFTRNASWYKTW